MLQVHKYVLRRNRGAIQEDFNVSILDHLRGVRILTNDHFEDIRLEKTKVDQASKFLDIIEGRGCQAFPELVVGLKHTLPHLADLIENWMKEASQKG